MLEMWVNCMVVSFLFRHGRHQERLQGGVPERLQEHWEFSTHFSICQVTRRTVSLFPVAPTHYLSKTHFAPSRLHQLLLEVAPAARPGRTHHQECRASPQLTRQSTCWVRSLVHTLQEPSRQE